jgi:GTP-binding protein
MVVANKLDLPDGRARLPEAQAAARRRGLACFEVSAATGEGMPAFLYALGQAVAEARAARAAAPAPTAAAGPGRQVTDPSGTEPEVPIQVVREGAGFRVLGDRPRRWVAMTDLDNQQALAYLQQRLRRAGVEELLTKAGARPGDEVLVGEVAFEYEPDPLASSRGRGRPRRPAR